MQPLLGPSHPLHQKALVVAAADQLSAAAVVEVQPFLANPFGS